MLNLCSGLCLLPPSPMPARTDPEMQHLPLHKHTKPSPLTRVSGRLLAGCRRTGTQNVSADGERLQNSQKPIKKPANLISGGVREQRGEKSAPSALCFNIPAPPAASEKPTEPCSNTRLQVVFHILLTGAGARRQNAGAVVPSRRRV